MTHDDAVRARVVENYCAGLRGDEENSFRFIRKGDSRDRLYYDRAWLSPPIC